MNPSDFEYRIQNLINLIETSRHTCLKGNTESERAQSMVSYINDGIDKGYSTFFTYKKCTEIINLTNSHLALALTSNNAQIRALAEVLKNS